MNVLELKLKCIELAVSVQQIDTVALAKKYYELCLKDLGIDTNGNIIIARELQEQY